MITKSIYEKKLVYIQERQIILKKYFNVEEKYMLDRKQRKFLAVAAYCCKALRYITEIENDRNIKYLWEKFRPDWQEKGVDISCERFRKLIKNVYSMKGEKIPGAGRNEYNLHDGLRLIVLDCIISKVCNVDDYYRHVVALMKAKNEQLLLGILKLMFVHYNDLRGYNGDEDV